MAVPIETSVDQLYRWVWRAWQLLDEDPRGMERPPDHILRAGASLCHANLHQQWRAGWIDSEEHLAHCDCHPAQIHRFRTSRPQPVDNSGD